MDEKRGLLLESEAKIMEAWAHAYVNNPAVGSNWHGQTTYTNLAYLLWIHIDMEIDPCPRWYTRALAPLLDWDAQKSGSITGGFVRRKNPGWDKKPPLELVQDVVADLPLDDPEVPEWSKHRMLSRMVREVRQDEWTTARIYRRKGLLKQPADLQIHLADKYLDRNTIRRRLDK